MTVNERLHRVGEELSDQEAETLLLRVEALRGDRSLRYLDSARVDDEPVTADEEAAIAEVETERKAHTGFEPVPPP
jgi:hypothetical protein